ncbi:RNA-directed DNA polymerase, eukaryota, reverse transcriptase zinc-binding domain protein [Tanacetum coccineum]|uniref:RNA-directed DNA polymerase, eukaryota, reverse transcriptase zinc-binding domain protein n=1 Tax=Tanacetum coccineum TaxID=301880 RepID=A0ABQ4WP76_9ASTR
MRFYRTIVYANKYEIKRGSLWKELDMHKQFIKKAHWVIMGDFNVTLNAAELYFGSSGKTSDMVEYSDTINSLEVEDICSSGFQFTWTKSLKNPRCNILKKLDRILINDEFLQNYQAAHGVFLPYTVITVLLSCTLKMVFLKRRADLAILWLIKKSSSNWSKILGKRKSMAVIFALKERLKSIQTNVDKNPHDVNLKKEIVLVLNDFVEASKDELKFLQRKAKVKWLKEGEQNTAFFHGEVVPKQFVKHFENFLGKDDQVTSVDDSLFINTLNSEEANNMICDVTDREIKECMFDIKSNKDSGPDGYTLEFFKKDWEVVGKEALAQINHAEAIVDSVKANMPKFVSQAVSNFVQPRLERTVLDVIKKNLMFGKATYLSHEKHHALYDALQESMQGEKKINKRKGAGGSSSKKGKAQEDTSNFERFEDADEPRQEQEKEHEVQTEVLEPEEHKLQFGSTVMFGKCMKKFLNKDKITKANLKGERFHNDLSKPLPLTGPPGRKSILTRYFFNNDLEYLRRGNEEKKYALSMIKIKAAIYKQEGI